MDNIGGKKRVRVGEHRVAYVERGQGVPVVFLHGNPTSSYLWRHMIQSLEPEFRCLAPDLIGMGDSDKLLSAGPDTYSFATHSRYLDAWLDAVVPDEAVILVMHDWGAALGFDWARRNPQRVRAVAYSEAVMGSTPLRALPAAAQAFFAELRSPAGEKMVLEHNLFVERMLSAEGILGSLSEADRAAYRRPFREPGEGRWPTLAWPRLLPYDGQPADICAITDAYRAFLASSPLPKLLISAEPGRLLVGELREICRAFPNQSEVTVRGLHYPQEDSPREFSAALGAWLHAVAATGVAAA